MRLRLRIERVDWDGALTKPFNKDRFFDDKGYWEVTFIDDAGSGVSFVATGVPHPSNANIRPIDNKYEIAFITSNLFYNVIYLLSPRIDNNLSAKSFAEITINT